ncbi:MAG: hypothetical protein H6828_15530 [Planctomycetes bacterium]|nr:hypothetical protein [Planctomycetota bacterium]
MPMRPLFALLALFAVLPLADAARPTPARVAETALKDADHQKAGKLIDDCIQAFVNRSGLREAEAELRDTLDKKWKKPAKDRDVLSLVEDLQASVYYSRNYSKAKGVKKGKVNEFELELPYYGKYTAKYELWAPNKYAAKDGPYPLLICIPGASESPAEHIEKRWGSSAVRESAIIVSMHMPSNEALWAGLGVKGEPDKVGGIGLLLSVFGDVRDRYAIDNDRVFLVGEGAGGVDAAMRIANSFPDRFAGIVGIAGDAPELAVDNFANLPVLLAGGGAKATAFDEAAKAAEYQTVQLSPGAKEEDIWGWMQAHPRRDFPERVVLLAGTPFPNKAYWLEMPPRGEGSTSRIDAKVDRASNTLTIEAKGVTNVTVYFNDLMLDLDQPVKVMLNGRESMVEIPRNFSSLMQQIYKSGSDPGKVFTALKDFDIPESKEEAKETVDGK